MVEGRNNESAAAAASDPDRDGEIIATRELTRDFGALRAVDSVSLSIRRGSITGLIGPNGAGKSTYFNTLTGALKPTSGRVILEGSPPLVVKKISFTAGRAPRAAK